MEGIDLKGAVVVMEYNSGAAWTSYADLGATAVIFLEPKVLYRAGKESVPTDHYEIPLGKARVRRSGTDLTLVTYGGMVPVSLRAAAAAAEEGTDVEVIDLRTIYPWDVDAVTASVDKTGRLLIVQEPQRTGGVAAEVAADLILGDEVELWKVIKGELREIVWRDPSVRGRAAALPHRPRTYFEEWPRPCITAIGWVAELVELAGGEEIFPEHRGGVHARDRTTDWDTVRAREPELMLASWCGAKFHPGKVRERPGWQELACVREDRLVEITRERLLVPEASQESITDVDASLIEAVPAPR